MNPWGICSCLKVTWSMGYACIIYITGMHVFMKGSMLPLTCFGLLIWSYLENLFT